MLDDSIRPVLHKHCTGLKDRNGCLLHRKPEGNLPPVRFRKFMRLPVRKPECIEREELIPFAIRLQPISSKTEQTFAIFRNY